MSNNSEEKIDFLIYAIIAQKKCEVLRKDFVFSRTFLVSKIYDPSFVEKKAESFINCYHESIIKINGNNKCIELKHDLKKCLGVNPNNIPKRCNNIIKSMHDCC